MRIHRSVLALTLLLLASVAYGQDGPKLTLPDTIRGEPGGWLVVQPETTAKAIVYISQDGLSAFPSSELKDARKLVLNIPRLVDGKTGYGIDRFRFVAVGTLNDIQIVQRFEVSVGNAPLPPIPPGPTPTPPTPDPKPPGPAPSPAPIPDEGFRAMIVYESANLLPTSQQAIIGSTEIRKYMATKAAKGSDNKTPEFRLFDQHTDVSRESRTWQAALARPRAGLPWIVISTGKTGYEGPLPMTVAETLTLLKKYGGE